MSHIAITATILVGLFAGLILAAIRSTVLSLFAVVGTAATGVWQFYLGETGNGDVTMLNHYLFGIYAIWTAVLMASVLAIIGIARRWTEWWNETRPDGIGRDK